MSKRTDTFLFVLIQKISSVGVQTGVVLYGCVTLLMTSFDVQQHHGAARHFTSVSAIAQEQIFPNWDMLANCWWCGENLVEFGRIDLEAERLNRGVLKRKTDLRGGPLIWIWCPDSESNQGHGDFQSPALPTELSRNKMIRLLHFALTKSLYNNFAKISSTIITFYVPSKPHIEFRLFHKPFFPLTFWISPRPISISQLHTLLHFHL